LFAFIIKNKYVRKCDIILLLGTLTFSTKKQTAFISSGVSYWKDAIRKFKAHQKSECHKEAVMKAEATPIDNVLNPKHLAAKELASDMVKKVVETVYLLARQGLALRGTTVKTKDNEASKAEVNEPNSNFIQVLRNRAIDDPRVEDWLRRSGNTYTSPSVQNEFLRLLSHDMLRHSIIQTIHAAQHYTIMVDETTDISNHEQAVFCLRYVDAQLQPVEKLIGLYKLENTKAATLVTIIKDVLRRCNLKVKDARGQCYDGAATMKGTKTGVATQILSEEPKAVYIHCMGHSLNLAVQDMVKGNKVLKDALDFSYELIKLIKKSPNRNAILDRIKATTSGTADVGIRTLCPTRCVDIKSHKCNYIV